MINAVKVVFLLALGTPCLAQEGLTIDNKNNERVSVAETEKIYFSACSVVREEFDVKRPMLPRVKLVLGAERDEIGLDQREIRLTTWDRYLFAQGVVVLTFADLLTWDRKIAMTTRAAHWAEATGEIEQVSQ